MLKYVIEHGDSDNSSDDDDDSDDSDEGLTKKSVTAKYRDMTRSQLKKMCKDSWLDEDGDKDDLIERLVEYEKPSGGWGSSGGPGSKKKKKGGTDLWGDDDGGDETPKQRKKRKTKEYESMSFGALKDLCSERGLSPQGGRDKIVERLVDEDPSDESEADDEDEEMAQWQRDVKRIKSKLSKQSTFELKQMCREKTVNPTGSDDVLIEKIIERELPKPDPKVVEHNPARRALREKYEKKKLYELQQYLRADAANANGTKEDLIIRLLDRQCPESDDGRLVKTPSHDPTRDRREDSEYGKKYNAMSESKLRSLCDENG